MSPKRRIGRSTTPKTVASNFDVMEPGFIGGILWLVFVATLGSWSLYYLALRKSAPARVTAVLYLSPPVVMIWASLMFGEALSWAMAEGLVVSLVGVIIVARQSAGAN